MKICFITGSRADYGLIKPVLDAVQESKFILQLIVLGSHSDPRYGSTISEIRKDGIKIDAEIKTSLKNDNPAPVVGSMGLELTGLSKAFAKLKPDLVFITGDRYEMLAAASAALIFRIPIAHLYGGDVTEGAFDDSIRHAITKLSALHFVSNETAQKRVIQMGENPKYVFNVGSPSLDKIKTLEKTPPQEFGISLRKFNLLATYHPETLAKQSPKKQISELLAAVKSLNDEHLTIFTLPNADPGGMEIRKQITAAAKSSNNILAFGSLGYQKYFSLMSKADLVIGNSSSGLYEAPSFKIPTINIGNRQKGRLKASSVIDVECDKNSILAAITKAKRLDCSKTKNPYGNGDSSRKIITVLNKINNFEQLIYKRFYDIRNS